MHYAGQAYYELIVDRQIEGEQREERTGHSPVGLVGTGQGNGRGTRTKGLARADSQEADRKGIERENARKLQLHAINVR